MNYAEIKNILRKNEFLLNGVLFDSEKTLTYRTDCEKMNQNLIVLLKKNNIKFSQKGCRVGITTKIKF